MLAVIERFVTRMKLDELRKQRDRLRVAYDELEHHARNAGTEVETLSRLYVGLRKLKFADRSLHPDVANLDSLLFEVGSDNIHASESISF